MTIAPEFSYAQARIQACFATLPVEDEWRRLAASRTLASFIEEARAGALREWVKGFSGQSDVHDLEAGLRGQYRDTLDAVAGWVPGPWREAVSWIRWLTLLPLLAHLQADGCVPGWVARDPSLNELLANLDRSVVRSPSNGRVQRFIRGGTLTVDAWAEEWRRSWPTCNRAMSLDLATLEILLRDHATTFRSAPPQSAWHLRRQLRERLRLRLHRSTLQPAVPFVYLALTALDIERLRAALVSRALFPDRDEPDMATAGRASA